MQCKNGIAALAHTSFLRVKTFNHPHITKLQGAFRALQRGYINWDSGRVDHLEINYRHRQFCHVRCKMVPSMKPGLYHVYMVLGKEGEFATIKKATCNCTEALGRCVNFPTPMEMQTVGILAHGFLQLLDL